MRSADVAIIGAGPAGSAAAIALAERGYEVALIDKQPFPREKLCGDFVNPINRPILRRLGVENELHAQQHASVTSFRITSESGAAADAMLRSAARPGTAGLGLRRAVLDDTLVRRSASLGAAVRLNSRVQALSRTARGWRFTAGAESWQAKILLGADGRNSWVAEQLGLNRGSGRRARSVGFQARLKSAEAAKGRVEIHLFRGGYAGLIRVGGSELNLCLALDRRVLPRGATSEFLLEKCLPRNPHLKDVIERSTEISPFRSAYPVYFSRRRSYAEHALLVGDAARVSEPVTGEGIYFAMRSGLLAAEVIAEALAVNDLSARFLRRYEQRCHQTFRRRMRLNSIMRFAIYRPTFMNPLLRLLSRRRRLLDSLVGTVCAAEPLG
jgi:geranylgeranyl reductase family protein